MLKYPITNRLHSFLMCKVTASNNDAVVKQASFSIRVLEQGYITADQMRIIRGMGYKSKQEELTS